MFIISSVLGAKYYPIPYRWGRLAGIMFLMGAVYGISLLVDDAFFAGVAIGNGQAWSLAAKLGVHTILIGLYAGGTLMLLKKQTHS